MPRRILGLIAALLLRGGLTFRTSGMALVTRRGQDVSRIRAPGRAVIAWSPAILIVVLARVSDAFAAGAAQGLALGTTIVMLGCAAWAIVRPSRGVPDRLAGNWLVPR